jgi:hypothetical protein
MNHTGCEAADRHRVAADQTVFPVHHKASITESATRGDFESTHNLSKALLCGCGPFCPMKQPIGGGRLRDRDLKNGQHIAG